jgi:hypothetical protein
LIEARIRNTDSGCTDAGTGRTGRADARRDANARGTDPDIACGARLVQPGIRPWIAGGTGLVDPAIARDRAGRYHRHRCYERRPHPAACLLVHL